MADPFASQLTRIGHVRGLRLTRAATDAAEATVQAVAAVERANDRHNIAEQTLAEARASLVANPSCGQSRLWLDRAIDKLVASSAAVAETQARLDLARSAQTEAVRAVARHEIREDAFATHRKRLSATHRRRAEDKAEADMPMIIRSRT